MLVSLILALLVLSSATAQADNSTSDDPTAAHDKAAAEALAATHSYSNAVQSYINQQNCTKAAAAAFATANSAALAVVIATAAGSNGAIPSIRIHAAQTHSLLMQCQQAGCLTAGLADCPRLADTILPHPPDTALLYSSYHQIIHLEENTRMRAALVATLLYY